MKNISLKKDYKKHVLSELNICKNLLENSINHLEMYGFGMKQGRSASDTYNMNTLFSLDIYVISSNVKDQIDKVNSLIERVSNDQ